VGRRLRGGAHAAAAHGLSHNPPVQVRDAALEDWEEVKELLAELGRPDVRDDPDEPQHVHEHVGWNDVAKAFSRTFGDIEWPPPKR
jgi:hypothetical protein